MGLGLALAFAACLATAPLAATAAPHSGPAAEVPSDTFCPRAVPKLIAFNEAAADGGKDLAKVTIASREAAYEYQVCIGEATTRTYDEPRINYDRVRAAQFLVVEGRALAATGDIKNAAQTLHDARKLAEYVAKWEPMAQGYGQSNSSGGYSEARTGDRYGSRYREAATMIVAAADTELAKLSAPAPAPQASSKPQ